MFEFWIDGVKYADPLNWNEFTETIEYDDTLNIFVFKFENKLKFSGGAYKYLYNLRNSGGICSVVDIEVKKQCQDGGIFSTVMTGKLFIADCLFSINKCIVECSVHDDNYTSLIFNNKDIKVALEGWYTKNGLSVQSLGTPLPNLGLTYLNDSNYLAQFPNLFDPSNGSRFDSQDARFFFIHDAFKYLVAFLTDYQCDFKSDYLDYTIPITTENEKVRNLMFGLGSNLRNWGLNLQVPTQISFEELFKEVNRLYPIVLTIEYDITGKPIIRIEDADYFRQSTTSVVLNNLPDVKEKSDNSLLFGSVKVGSKSATYDSLLHTYVPIRNITFAEENYYLNGECNTATTKDLFGSWLDDTNIIEEITISDRSNTSYDSDIIFMEVDPISGFFSAIYNALDTVNYDDATNYHYNNNLLNVNVVRRNRFHNNVSIPSGIGINLDNNSTSATVVNLSTAVDCASGVPPAIQVSAYQPLVFNIDNVSVFNGTKYTALDSGFYAFFYDLSYQIDLYSGGACPATIMNRNVIVTTKVERYNASNVLQETQLFSDTLRNAVGNYDYSFAPVFSMLANDYIVMSSSYASEPTDFSQDSGCQVQMFLGSSIATFRTTATANGSENIGDNYVCNIITFNYPIAEQPYQTIRSNIYKMIDWNIDGTNNRSAWIKRIVRNISSSQTEWELISDINNSQ